MTKKEIIILVILIIDFALILWLGFQLYAYKNEEDVVCPVVRTHVCTRIAETEEDIYTLTEKYEFETDLNGYMDKAVFKLIYKYKDKTDYENSKLEVRHDRYSVIYDDKNMQVILTDEYMKLGEDKWIVSFSKFLTEDGYTCS